MKIGILALQGSVKEHFNMLKKCDVEPVLVKFPSDLRDVKGLIIPGGESTTIGKLLRRYGLDKEIKKRHKEGMAIYGTCAGAILLARDIVDSKQPKLGLMDISIKRNDYGRQVDSFEAELDILGKPFKGIFIRAPVIDAVHDGCRILGRFKNKPIMVEQGSLLASTFHPELTDDLRIHKHFVELARNSRDMLF
ncbi:pyridoxal 5'-phosphate synthase glutaminase subunit PdxT [Candidatus Woesearchaeota archaeon]|nr:pyridoxal 5'-phosphate synthase glutaminase subunit PdxT [Candidatus Woesearchaeota archaeon]